MSSIKEQNGGWVEHFKKRLNQLKSIAQLDFDLKLKFRILFISEMRLLGKFDKYEKINMETTMYIYIYTSDEKSRYKQNSSTQQLLGRKYSPDY